MRNDADIRHTTQLLGDTVAPTPCTLEGFQKLVQQTVWPPEEPERLGLKHVRKVRARIVCTFELIHFLVQFQQHVLGCLAEHTAELAKAQVT